MSSRWNFAVASLLILTAPTRAQFFEWGFNATQSLTINECDQLAVAILAPSSGTAIVASPPFYMFAYATSGITTATIIGTESSALSYQVNHPAGTTLLMQVADAEGRSGGVAGLYTVQTPGGGASSCTLASTSSSINLKANTSSIATCGTLGLQISGGQPPYNITVAANNQATVINATLPSGDNLFNFVDRVPPGNEFIVAVSDSTGTWAQNTGLISTTGSTDTTCTGLESSSGKSSGSSGQSSSSSTTSSSATSTSTSSGSSNPHKNSDTGAVIGGVLAGLLFIAVAGLLFWFFFGRHRQRNRNSAHTQVLPPLIDTWDLKHGRGASSTASASMSAQGTFSTMGQNGPSYGAVPYGEITPYPPSAPSMASSRRHSPPSHYSQSTHPAERPQSAFDPYGGIETEPYNVLASSAAAYAHYQQHGQQPPSIYPPSPSGSAAALALNSHSPGVSADFGSPGGGTSMSGGSSSGWSRSQSRTLMAVNAGESEGSGGRMSAGAEKRALATQRAEAEREQKERLLYQHQDAGTVEELPPAYRDHRAGS